MDAAHQLLLNMGGLGGEGRPTATTCNNTPITALKMGRQERAEAEDEGRGLYKMSQCMRCCLN